jgi:hypothetical protein
MTLKFLMKLLGENVFKVSIKMTLLLKLTYNILILINIKQKNSLKSLLYG